MGIDIHADADAMEVLAQQIASMTVIGRLFAHHAVVYHYDHIRGIAICIDGATLPNILASRLPLHALIMYACPYIWLIGALMHQPASSRHD